MASKWAEYSCTSCFFYFWLVEYILLNSLCYNLISILVDFVLPRHIHHFVFLTSEIFRECACLVYHFHPGLALFIDYMVVFNLFTWNENFSSVQTVVKFYLALRDQIFLYNHNSIFTLFSCIIQDEISSRLNELKYQPGLKISMSAM